MTSAVASRSASSRGIVIALAGRQNAGKTSLVMHLTGTKQRPVNFPGTSVERQESSVLRDGQQLRFVDLPGIASVHAVSPDEAIAVEFLRGEAGEAPDVICVVMDASKLSVELRLLAEIAALGCPVVVALTKNDVASRRGGPVDAEALAAVLELPVIELNAQSGAGSARVLDAAAGAAGTSPPTPRAWDPDQIADAVVTATSGAVVTRSERVDRIILHRVWGLPILGALMFGLFQLIFSGADPFIGWIEAGQGGLGDWVAGAIPPGALRSFLVDGLVGGVGAIVVFLPQIVLLMALVALLEGTGYMARAAFLLDRVLSRVGLSGRSFVPMVTSFACAVPGILGARIIDDERDRIATIVTAPLMSCSARLPVYVVLIGAFFPSEWAGIVLIGLYGMGIVVAAVVAWLLRRTVLRGGVSALMMELPAYQKPVPRVVLGQVWEGTRAFVVMAGTFIFAVAIVIWFLSYYPRPAEIHAQFEAERSAAALVVPACGYAAGNRLDSLQYIDAREARAYLEQSYLARAGKAVQPLFAPAGFDWRTTVGILAAFPARELIVPTLGILYGVGDVDPADYDMAELGLAAQSRDGLRAAMRVAVRPDGSPAVTPLTAIALMVFFALCSQCAATLAAIRRETGSWRWPVFTFAYMTTLAWLAAVAVMQIGQAAGLGGA